MVQNKKMLVPTGGRGISRKIFPWNAVTAEKYAGRWRLSKKEKRPKKNGNPTVVVSIL